MRSIRILLCLVLMYAHVATCATKVRPVNHKACQDPIFVQKCFLIDQATRLIPPLVRIIVEYDPPSLQWAPLLDEVDYSYQYVGTRKQKFHQRRCNFSFFQRNQGQLQILGLRTCNGRLCDSIEHTPYNNQKVDMLKEKIQVGATKEHHFIEEYLDESAYVRLNTQESIQRHALDLLHYLISDIQLKWVSPDSDEYQRARQRSLLLLDSEVSLCDIERLMTEVYKKICSCADKEVRKYKSDYEKSVLPGLLKQASPEEGLVPLLFRFVNVDSQSRKRKR